MCRKQIPVTSRIIRSTTEKDTREKRMDKGLRSAAMKFLLAFSAFSLIVLLVITFSGSYRVGFVDTLRREDPIKVSDSNAVVPPKDKYFGGLLTTAFDEHSCLSRYQAAQYWNEYQHKPSPYLLEKLRKYEALHKKCGPKTEPFRKAVQELKEGRSSNDTECSYVVWIPDYGLGNRIISIVSGFLYAVLNEKVLLLGGSDDLQDIFCEPFPGTSWVLSPEDEFPVNYDKFGVHSDVSYGNMLRKRVFSNGKGGATSAQTLPPFVYLHILHDYTGSDMTFFTDEAQDLLRRIPWLILRSNLYFVPGLFLPRQYEKELNKMFPEKDAVFNLLARYLIHPTNSVWSYITRYYGTYLAKADERVGIQVRIFQNARLPFERMFPQIMNCTLNHGLLPQLDLDSQPNAPRPASSVKAVLVASLHAVYYDKIRNMYNDHATITGELVAVYQPSHEEQQHTEKRDHNAKALAEMYLLSFSDSLVTTGYSTFGYVAAGLGGLQPWMMVRRMEAEPKCTRALSMEPCFLNPPYVDFKDREGVSATGVQRPAPADVRGQIPGWTQAGCLISVTYMATS